MRPNQHNDRERPTAIFRDLSPHVFAHAWRHCDVDTAQDIVADTFLVAWRRLNGIPTNDPPDSWSLHAIRSPTIIDAKVDKIDWHAVARLAYLAATDLSANHHVIERAALLEAQTDKSHVQ